VRVERFKLLRSLLYSLRNATPVARITATNDGQSLDGGMMKGEADEEEYDRRDE